jgi:hypothetical protein
MRRRKLLWVLAGLAVLVVFALAAFWPQPERQSQYLRDRVTKGMSLEEVSALLGPPGDYRNGPTVPAASGYTWLPSGQIVPAQPGTKSTMMGTVLLPDPPGDLSLMSNRSTRQGWSFDTEEIHI